jgi:hypothetical protein
MDPSCVLNGQAPIQEITPEEYTKWSKDEEDAFIKESIASLDL